MVEQDKRTREMELVTLSLLAESAEPVGSPRLVSAFHAAGIDLAEATAGRYLRSLDERGLTVRVGRQGRVITDRGRRRLEHVELLERLHVQSSALVRILSDRDADQLADILELRRAVEGEAARLAALRATDEERRHLCLLASQHAERVTQDEDGKQVSLNFHLAVAMASHSPIVQTTVELLIEPTNDPVMQLLDLLTLEAGAQHAFAHEHGVVAEAIARHDPDAAEAAMRAHVDALFGLVEAFLARTS